MRDYFKEMSEDSKKLVNVPDDFPDTIGGLKGQDEKLRCPRCGSEDIVHYMIAWDARSKEYCDLENTAVLWEHQCTNCRGASFWTGL